MYTWHRQTISTRSLERQHIKELTQLKKITIKNMASNTAMRHNAAT